MNDKERPVGAEERRPSPRRGAAWRWSAYLATTLGLMCALFKWNGQALVIVALSIAVCGVPVCAAVWCDRGPRAAARALQLALVTGVVITAATGLIAVLGVGGLLLLLVLTATSPPLLALARRRWPPSHGRNGRNATHGSPADDSTQSWDRARNADILPRMTVDLSVLDDEALCLAWRRSFLQLTDARGMQEFLRVVEERRRYLDELHRRSPEGLAAWWAAGGRASGAPLPYLRDSRSRPEAGDGG